MNGKGGNRRSGEDRKKFEGNFPTSMGPKIKEWHPSVLNPKTAQWDTNWLMSYSSEEAALEYAEAWAEMVHAEKYDAVEAKDE